MANPLHVTSVGHIGVRVHALDRAVAFYGLLGFELIGGPMGPEPVAILMTADKSVEINLVLNAPDPPERNVLMDVDDKHAGITHVALVVPDLDAAVEALARADVPLSGGPVNFPGGARGAFVRDPDRNVIELHQRAR
jgi:lactoylglutathione lyase